MMSICNIFSQVQTYRQNHCAVLIWANTMQFIMKSDNSKSSTSGMVFNKHQ